MPNIVFLIVDTLRYDRLGISGYRPAVSPNLDALAATGISCPNHFATGCVTSFAFPALFTSSLPLDYGGYDEGIRRRPIAFPEILREHGFETYGLVTGHPCSSHFGYDRGFEHFLDLIDLYQWFRSIYIAALREIVEMWTAGTIDEARCLALLVPKYRRVLDDSLRFIDELDAARAPESGRKRAALREAVKAERALLDADPGAVREKIRALGPDYQFALGLPKLDAATRRRIERRNRRFARANRRVHLLSHRRAFDASEVNRQFARFLARRSTRPFFALLHYFDLHEAKLQLSKLLARPTPRRLARDMHAWARIRRGRAPGQRGLLYDMGLAQVDAQLGRLRRLLADHGLAQDTILVVTGDHGTEAGHPHRGLGSDLPRLFYDEHLHVPLIVNGPGIAPEEIGALASHLDLAPTILDIAGIEPPEVFQGLPIRDRRARPAPLVWSENAGLGRCRIAAKPLHIAVRSETHKTIAIAENFTAREREFYDLANDPFERDNLAGDARFAAVRAAHLEAIQARLERLRAENVEAGEAVAAGA